MGTRKIKILSFTACQTSTNFKLVNTKHYLLVCHLEIVSGMFLASKVTDFSCWAGWL